jgi:2-polyprenyl-6-methoxyphenol hydroxylase-like FAD-dependent oxidoreductase
VTLTDGTVSRYDLVVGADGINSWTREQIHGDKVRPQYTGHMSLRWLLHDAPDVEPGFYNSRHTTVILGLLRGGTVYVSTGCDLPLGRVEPERARELLRERLEDFTAPSLRVVRERLTGEATVLARPYEWLLVPAPWHSGRVTLIGDAAHATTAHLSSGGAMALEDAVVLARELASSGDVGEALDRFTAARLDRVRIVVDTSVELMRMQQRSADPRAMAMLRGRAMAELSTPY